MGTPHGELSVSEKLLLAAHTLEQQGKQLFSAEDLVVAAWRAFPLTFGLRGHADAAGTPAHPDSNRVFAEIMGSKPIRKKGLLVKTGTKMYSLTESGRLLFDAASQGLPGYRIDFYLREGDLSLGKDTFEVLWTPGHSPGSLSVYWPERKALFTGDVILYGGIGRTDFTEGDPALLGESIQRLARLDTELVLPGHGEIMQGRDAVGGPAC
jgi:hypothetical protein